MWSTSTRADSAEWQCTRCNVTNRRLVPVGAAQAVDQCLHCHLEHVIRRDASPVRWTAEAKR